MLFSLFAFIFKIDLKNHMDYNYIIQMLLDYEINTPKLNFTSLPQYRDCNCLVTKGSSEVTNCCQFNQ